MPPTRPKHFMTRKITVILSLQILYNLLEEIFVYFTSTMGNQLYQINLHLFKVVIKQCLPPIYQPTYKPPTPTPTYMHRHFNLTANRKYETARSNNNCSNLNTSIRSCDQIKHWRNHQRNHLRMCVLTMMRLALKIYALTTTTTTTTTLVAYKCTSIYAYTHTHTYRYM